MTREEEILQAAKKEAWYIADTSQTKEEAAISGYCLGINWADENPNKKLVYTKKELLNMGFTFDLNGNIVTPRRENDSLERFIKYREDKLIEKACKWLRENIDLVVMDTVNARSGYHEIVMMNNFEQKFREAMEE